MTSEAMPSAIARQGRPERSELMKQRLAAARWFLLPMMAALAVVAGWPLLRSIWFSFTDASLTDLYGSEFIGFGNYLRWSVL